MGGKNGQKGGLSVLWIPKKRHSHKKEKYYKPHAEKSTYRGSGSGMFSNGSPYSRRKHQEDPVMYVILFTLLFAFYLIFFVFGFINQHIRHFPDLNLIQNLGM